LSGLQGRSGRHREEKSIAPVGKIDRPTQIKFIQDKTSHRNAKYSKKVMVAKIAIIIKDYYENCFYEIEAELTSWSTSNIEKIRIC
jgi:hypothetical protein